MSATVLELVIRLGLGALASVFAIISWTKARSLSWVFVVVGVLSSYATTLYDSLLLFGFFSGDSIQFFGSSVASIISSNVSIIFFAIACVVYIRSGN